MHHSVLPTKKPLHRKMQTWYLFYLQCETRCLFASPLSPRRRPWRAAAGGTVAGPWWRVEEQSGWQVRFDPVGSHRRGKELSGRWILSGAAGSGGGGGSTTAQMEAIGTARSGRGSGSAATWWVAAGAAGRRWRGVEGEILRSLLEKGYFG